ncbi:hypothetical protein AB0L57_19925 [Nocardia sp. NPDC052254]|uniref:hypothetical protein n=1 Tax=Nocardia sp. NPDC052254 TaxID=3155681 RepID=UPI0034419B3C
MELVVGEQPEFEWRPELEVTVTEKLLMTVALARAAVSAIAIAGQTITYGKLATALDDRFNYRRPGVILDLLSLDCIRRDEPSLAALVVQASTGRPGDGYVHGDVPIKKYQRQVQEFWQQPYR